ncbi:MAG: hypothetical protein JXM74_06685 [Fusobacteriaceae bacterium]|nr:hypothetical protein [Fusobacteriaceae bacterium]MBN2838427.1 hypothetical protein [Fusobacteriaceae bacterium]
MSTNFYSLKYNETRQVKVTKNGLKEELRLYANGIEFSYNKKTGSYVGCGIDAAHSFMGWFSEGITRSAIKSHINVTEWPSDTKNAIMEVLTLSLWDSKDEYFTTPADMSVGLEKPLNSALKNRHPEENNTIRYNKGTDLEVVEQIQFHLKNALPVIALINGGGHWVTIAGMKYEYSNSGIIDLNSVDITYIDLTAGDTKEKKYADLKINGWSSVGTKMYESYLPGTLVSMKTDSVLYSNKWSSGWNGKIYEVNNKKFLFLIKESTGAVHIHNISANGSIGDCIDKYDWSSGWSNINFFELNNKCYLFHYKTSNGLVHINEINLDGKNGKNTFKGNFSKNMCFTHIFKIKSQNFIIFSDNKGNLKIHDLTSDGKIGTILYEGKNIFANKHNDLIKIQSMDINNKTFLYILDEKAISIYEAIAKNSKIELNLVDKKNIKPYYTSMNVFVHNDNPVLLINRGDYLNVRNGEINIYSLNKTTGKIESELDKNYFTNRFSIVPNAWSYIEYFRTTDNQIKLFLLDKNSGNVRILNMKDDLTFDTNLVLSKELDYFQIKVKTGNVEKAGTDANVYITLKDSKGNFEKLIVDSIYDDFEKNQEDIFYYVPRKKLEDITNITVGHDNSGSKPGWFLENIKITKKGNTSSWDFNCHMWLSKSDGDKKIERDLKRN